MLISAASPTQPCPCGTGRTLGQCCGQYHDGKLPAPTAETLMRSRYSAYCLKNIDYLVNTEHPDSRQPNARQSIAATARSATWVGLKVLGTKAGGGGDDTGVVEFMAVYRSGAEVAQLHERSRFRKEAGRWFYVDGDMLPPWRPKKNEPCWCGSGKKFKQCHGKKR
ncbi:MAG: YchJ family protein [Geitlerinemataceae cyanobacterium]